MQPLSKSEIDRGIKRFLTSVGKKFEEFLKEKLNRKWPPSSRVGEYPAKRTGSLQASVGFKGGPSGWAITLGIIKDVFQNGKQPDSKGRGPTYYGAVLEFDFYRKLVMDAWEEFWPTIDHRIIVMGTQLRTDQRGLPYFLNPTLEVVRLTKPYGSKEEYLELRGLEEVFESRPTIMGLETERQAE